MARKKAEPIVSLGNDDNKLLVQKSQPLFSLWKSDLTLAEFKILDTYLSRIDSHNPDKRTVVFEKGELEKILGVQKINQPELEKRLIHLMGNVVKVPDNEAKKGFRLVTLFQEAVAEQDDYGIWQIKMECTQKAMKYFFNIENLGYLRYKLRCITSITSRYTYILFIYLEANRFRKSWTVDLQRLKEILNCDKEETYKAFKRFNDLILKKVQKEMHEKTECRFSYEPVKKGRSVVAIKFTVEILPEIAVDVAEPEPSEMSIDNPLYLLSQACENEFSKEQMEVIFAMISPMELEHVNGIEIARYHYLAEKYAILKMRASKDKIVHRFNYFKKLIEADCK